MIGRRVDLLPALGGQAEGGSDIAGLQGPRSAALFRRGHGDGRGGGHDPGLSTMRVRRMIRQRSPDFSRQAPEQTTPRAGRRAKAGKSRKVEAGRA